jgi:hypothetical protein
MPLTEKGSKIESEMKKEYGPKKGEQVFYASRNKGTISGVDSVPIGRGYDADPERLQFKSHEAKNPVEQRRKEREAAMARGENPYPTHPPENKDSVPLGSCYKDDVPPALLYGEPKISPTSTSQYSGMQEQLRTAPQPEPVEPIDAWSDIDAFAKLGAAGDAWTDMLGRRDFSGDVNSPAGKLPAEVTYAQIKQMGAGFNYNQGYGGDPYKK